MRWSPPTSWARPDGGGRGLPPPPSEIFDLDEGLQEIASAGIEAVLAGPARALPQVHDFTAHSRLLDIGGGTGSWAIAIAQQNPHLQATIFELPAVVGFANERIAAAGLQARVDAVVGDAMSGSLPEGYDVLLAANLLHYWSPDQVQAFLQRARASVAAGTTLLLADFWTDPTHTQPVHAALMAGEFAVHLEHGDVYSVEVIQASLTGAGWTFREHASLAGPQSVIVATV
ncbi:MAG: methyltransferase [Nocardioides sp.]